MAYKVLCKKFKLVKETLQVGVKPCNVYLCQNVSALPISESPKVTPVFTATTDTPMQFMTLQRAS